MRAALDLSTLVHLRISDAGSSNVWSIQLPWMLWNHAAAAEERRTVVGKLTAAFPYRSLWLSDWVTDGEARWCQLATAEDPCSYEGLESGGWALLFFEEEQAVPEQPLDQLPIDAASANKLLRRFSARAAITSLVDDEEWLLAIAE